MVKRKYKYHNCSNQLFTDSLLKYRALENNEYRLCEQINSESFMKFTKFFDLDPTVVCSSKAKISIPGLKKPLIPFQAFCLWWQMNQERGPVAGGIIGNEMGLGKTIQMISHILIEANLALAKAEVTNEWKSGVPSQHLPEHTSKNRQQPDARCPSGTKFGMRCPCERWGPTFFLDAHKGATLIFVPATLVLTFKAEWDRFVDEKAGPCMKLHVEYGKKHHIAPEVDNILSTKLEAECHEREDGSEDVDWVMDEGEVEHTSHVLLTSYQTWASRLLRRWKAEASVKVKDSRGRTKIETCEYYKISLTRFILDEMHSMKGYTTIAMKLMRELGFAKRWGYSGTPIDGQPQQAVGAFLKALGGEHWDTNPALKYGRGELWKKLNKCYSQITDPSKSDKMNSEEFEEKFKFLKEAARTLWPKIMLRFKHTTPWGRTELMPNLPRSQHEDIIVRLPAEVARSINERQSGIFRRLAEKNQKGQMRLRLFFQYCMPTRVLTTYPFLNNMVEERQIDGLVSADIIKGGLTNWEKLKKSTLYKNRASLRDTSPKYKALLGYQKDHLLSKGVSELEPHLVMSCSPFVATTTWMVSDGTTGAGSGRAHLPC